MAALTKDIAIILKSILFEDRHRIVTGLTEHHGLVSAMARNAVQSRRFGGTLEMFVVSDWSFALRETADLCQLTEAQFKEGYPGIQADFQKLAVASALSELMVRVAPQREGCTNLFRLHLNALRLLNAVELKPGFEIPLLNAYLAKLLQWGGHQPRTACLECQQNFWPIDPTQFEIELSGMIVEGGWLCVNCAGTPRGNYRVSLGAIADLYAFFVSPIRQVFDLTQAPVAQHRNLFSFLEALLFYHVPGFDKQPIKSFRFLGLDSRL